MLAIRWHARFMAAGVERYLYVGDRYEPYINTAEGSRYIFLALEVHTDGAVVLKPPVPWGVDDWLSMSA